MTSIKKLALPVTAFLMITAANSGMAATIALGDTIVLDFGKTGQGQETTGNWNNIAGAPSTAFEGSGSIVIGNLVRYSDGAVVSDLTLTKELPTGGFAGIGGADVTPVGSSASFTVTGTIPDSAQNDTSYFASELVTLAIGGLNSSLTYNLELLSMISPDRNAHDISVNGTTISVDPNLTPWVTAFNNISANVNDEIVISFSGINNVDTADFAHINAFELTAVPEPSSIFLVLVGLSGLGLLLRRR